MEKKTERKILVWVGIFAVVVVVVIPIISLFFI